METKTKARPDSKTVSPELLQSLDAYWRAANYLSVGQIYLCDKPCRDFAFDRPLLIFLSDILGGKNFAGQTGLSCSDSAVGKKEVCAGSCQVIRNRSAELYTLLNHRTFDATLLTTSRLHAPPTKASKTSTSIFHIGLRETTFAKIRSNG